MSYTQSQYLPHHNNHHAGSSIHPLDIAASTQHGLYASGPVSLHAATQHNVPLQHSLHSHRPASTTTLHSSHLPTTFHSHTQHLPAAAPLSSSSAGLQVSATARAHAMSNTTEGIAIKELRQLQRHAKEKLDELSKQHNLLLDSLQELQGKLRTTDDDIKEGIKSFVQIGKSFLTTTTLSAREVGALANAMTTATVATGQKRKRDAVDDAGGTHVRPLPQQVDFERHQGHGSPHGRAPVPVVNDTYDAAFKQQEPIHHAAGHHRAPLGKKPPSLLATATAANGVGTQLLATSIHSSSKKHPGGLLSRAAAGGGAASGLAFIRGTSADSDATVDDDIQVAKR